MACTLPDKTSESVRNAFATLWIKHYQAPDLVVTDQGPEFTGHEFSNYVGEQACLHHFIDSQSPWQQGRTERAGGSLKEDLRDVIEECGIVTNKEFDLALTQALDARNRFSNRSGFSAHQRVFGTSLRLPGSMLSDDHIDRLSLHTDPSTDFRRAADIRAAAHKAFIKHSDRAAIDRAILARPRALQKQTLREGDVVYVWRNSQRSKVKGLSLIHI